MLGFRLFFLKDTRGVQQDVGIGNAQVRDYGGIVMIPAVAFRRDIYDKVDVETWPSGYDGFCVFGDFAVKRFGGVPVPQYCRFVLAQGHALSAAYAFSVIDDGGSMFSGMVGLFRLFYMYGIMCAMLYAYPAAPAVAGFYDRLG